MKRIKMDFDCKSELSALAKTRLTSASLSKLLRGWDILPLKTGGKSVLLLRLDIFASHT
jgi:hypothetical protein